MLISELKKPVKLGRAERERAVKCLIQAIGEKALKTMYEQLTTRKRTLPHRVRDGVEACVAYTLVRGGFHWDAGDYRKFGAELVREAAGRDSGAAARTLGDSGA